ncbi:MAG: DUF4080 domain-containing protein [Pseudobdellovibrionaceae bacterium]
MPTNSTSPEIILATINASYQHCSFGLRYLYANMKDLQNRTRMIEYTIHQNPRTICEEILKLEPKIVGFGVYIWNAEETLRVISILKKVAPHIQIILGGPEISYETEQQRLYQLCDYVICGEADFAFPKLCHEILAELDAVVPATFSGRQKLITQTIPAIQDIQLPYSLYSDEDIANRVIYVEASRGCPYKCEYCLSSLDKSVRSFELNHFLQQMDELLQRGVRQFKFVDRTFNLSISSSTQILEFFLKHIHLGLFLHFEMVPDRLPDELKVLIEKFPVGSLQFEIGIQTLSPAVAQNISRRNDLKKAKANFEYLKSHHVHTHADLIVGLPGETMESFGQGFDQLLSWNPDEVQVGILKRLKGTPIERHEKTFAMVYSDQQPYEVLSTKDMSFAQIQFMQKFAKFWDLFSNSGKFAAMMQLLFQNTHSSFQSFTKFVLYLETQFSKTYAIHQDRLLEAFFNYLISDLSLEKKLVLETMAKDIALLHPKGHVPQFLKTFFKGDPHLEQIYLNKYKDQNRKSTQNGLDLMIMPERQRMHMKNFNINSPDTPS